MNRRMIIMLAGCAVVFGGIFGFKWFIGRMINQAMDNMPMPPATVSATAARRETWAAGLGSVGTLRAVYGTDVTTEASGIIDSIQFDSADTVAAGAVLITLDSATDRAELAALEAQAQLAEQDIARAQQLFTREAVSKSDLDRQAAAVAAARANVQAQRARIALKVIRAPFAGELGIRQVDIGQYVSPGLPIVTLQSLDPIYADFWLPQQYLASVREGLKVQIALEAFDGHRFPGEITAVEPRVDQSTRNFQVRATLANPERLLRPGMFARVEVDLGTSGEVVVIPQTAVSYNPYGDAVWVIAEGTTADGTAGLVAQRRIVRTGQRRGDLVAITGGLEAGEQVATSGLLKLRNGMGVVINNDVQPSAESAPTPPNS